MENMGMISKEFWKGKKVFITGHTGFKGTWLSIWLKELDAIVKGYSLDPPTDPSLFTLCNMNSTISSITGDIRDYSLLRQSIENFNPDIVIHMAAQSLVRKSYKDPIETYSVNVMGTVNLLESVRNCKSVKAVLNVTTDKCYDNQEWVWGYRENEPLGGYDPYSSSKACSELVTSAFRSSFLNSIDHGVAVASARAGNVIGGGDWATDRLIPDIVRSLLKNEPIVIRNPDAIRPWQHVLEPLNGYLLLLENLFKEGTHFAEAWNFGPNDQDVKPVRWIVDKICSMWGEGSEYVLDVKSNPHEAHYLKLDCSKANHRLGWQPRWKLEDALDKIVEWTHAYNNNENIKEVCLRQIREYSDA